MKAIMIVFMTFRVSDHVTPPFWTWFIQNPRTAA